jgi:anti-sigma factor RsiW
MWKECAMPCNDALRIQAYFDGELDAGASLEVERHLETCPACAALLRDLQATRGDIREQDLYHRASPALRANIANALDRETGSARPIGGWLARGKSFWAGAASGIGATALAAALAFFVLLPPATEPLVNDVMGAHLRSLMANHLIDVASSDQHTVKPWFAGHADVSPPAVDFPKEDYRLVGGRADYVDGRRAAVVVYRHGAHIINVFAWAQRGGALPNIVTRSGYHAVFWRSGDLVFCAVSDTALDELLGLTRLLKEISVPDSRE